MVSPNVNNLTPAMYRIATAQQRSTIVDEIKAYVRSLITKHLTDNVQIEFIRSMAHDNEVVTSRVLKEISNILVDDADIVHYSHALVKDIGLDNPMVYMESDTIAEFRALVNATSGTILYDRDRDPVVGYCHPHTTINQLWNDYLCSLLFWNREWFQHCSRLITGITTDEDPDAYLDDDSSSVDDDSTIDYDSDEHSSVADDE